MGTISWHWLWLGLVSPPGSSGSLAAGPQRTGLARRWVEGGGRAWLSGQISAQDLQQREDGGHKKVAPGREVPLGRARGSHLVGPNGGRKEASEVGKRLLGPPLHQEGDLGTGEGLRAGHGPSVPLQPCSWVGSTPCPSPCVGGGGPVGLGPQASPLGAAPNAAAGPD